MADVFTSGTTSDPKRISFDEAALDARIAALAKVRPPGWMEVRSIFCDQKPYSISHARDSRWMSQVGGVLYGQQESLDDTIRLIVEKQPDVVVAAPGYLAQFADGVAGRYCPRFVLASTEKMTPAQAKRIMAGLGPNLWSNYAATEVGTISYVSGQRAMQVPGCVGKPCEGVKVRLVGAVPYLAGGLIEVQTETVVASIKLTPDGWFQTGDIGKLSPMGEIVLAGRAALSMAA